MALWNPFGRKPKNTDPTKSDPPASDPVESTSEPVESNAPKETPDAVPPAPAPQSAEPEPAPEKKKGIFGGLKSALRNTVKVLNTDIRDLVKEGRLVDDAFLDELFAHLVKTDMGAGPAGKIRDGIKSEFRGRKLEMSDLIGSAKTTISEIMELSLIHI